jgi:uncharacterized protein (DUF924 family)
MKQTHHIAWYLAIAFFGAVGTIAATHAPTASAAEEPQTGVPQEAREVVAFWREAGPARWFAKDAIFDQLFRERFAAAHDDAACGKLDAWLETPEGALALILLLDQYPRNAFRGTRRMYETDPYARAVADAAIKAGHDRSFPGDMQKFFYLPFAHSENLADQRRSVELVRHLGAVDLRNAQRHHDIVARFGRFPHRNLILGRDMRPEEQAYLDSGGYAG